MSDTEELSKSAMTHPQLIPGWTAPVVPHGYTKCVVVAYGPARADVELDFLSEERMDFASEVDGITLPRWPWRTGFVPKKADWGRISFEYLTV